MSDPSCRGAGSTHAKLDPEESTSTSEAISYTVPTCKMLEMSRGLHQRWSSEDSSTKGMGTTKGNVYH